MSALMSDQQSNSNVAEFFSPGPGERLRAARLSMGFDLAKIASELHLTTPVVEALEADQYADIGARVFVRGYLRNYARIVDMPVESILPFAVEARSALADVVARLNTQSGGRALFAGAAVDGDALASAETMLAPGPPNRRENTGFTAPASNDNAPVVRRKKSPRLLVASADSSSSLPLLVSSSSSSLEVLLTLDPLLSFLAFILRF